MLIIQDRTFTAHIYNRASAESIVCNIRERYRPCFQQLRVRLEDQGAP